MTAPAKMAAPKKVAAKSAIDTYRCRGGEGRYLSPKSMKACANPRHPGRQLCDSCETIYRAAKKKAAPAKTAQPKVAAVKPARPATMESEIAAVRKMKASKAKAVAPDAQSVCNNCDVNPALPDSAAGYCEECEAAATTVTVAALVAPEE